MNLEQKVRDTAIVREIAQTAGLNVSTAFVTLEAVSEAQREYAEWVRVEALAGIWEERINSASKNAKMANAIIVAANRQTTAKWWLDRTSNNIVRGGFINELHQAITEEMSKR